jgi:hypothetical protein
MMAPYRQTSSAAGEDRMLQSPERSAALTPQQAHDLRLIAADLDMARLRLASIARTLGRAARPEAGQP